MLILEALKDKKPNGVVLNTPSIRHFVREHFDQLNAVREKGYSWKQIAAVVQDRMHFHSSNLAHSISSAFIKERLDFCDKN